MPVPFLTEPRVHIGMYIQLENHPKSRILDDEWEHTQGLVGVAIVGFTTLSSNMAPPPSKIPQIHADLLLMESVPLDDFTSSLVRSLVICCSRVRISTVDSANSGTFSIAPLKDSCALRSDCGTRMPYQWMGSLERNLLGVVLIPSIGDASELGSKVTSALVTGWAIVSWFGGIFSACIFSQVSSGSSPLSFSLAALGGCPSCLPSSVDSKRKLHLDSCKWSLSCPFLGCSSSPSFSIWIELSMSTH